MDGSDATLCLSAMRNLLDKGQRKERTTIHTMLRTRLSSRPQLLRRLFSTQPAPSARVAAMREALERDGETSWMDGLAVAEPQQEKKTRVAKPHQRHPEWLRTSRTARPPSKPPGASSSNRACTSGAAAKRSATVKPAPTGAQSPGGWTHAGNQVSHPPHQKNVDLLPQRPFSPAQESKVALHE